MYCGNFKSLVCLNEAKKLTYQCCNDGTHFFAKAFDLYMIQYNTGLSQNASVKNSTRNVKNRDILCVIADRCIEKSGSVFYKFDYWRLEYMCKYTAISNVCRIY